MYKQRCPEALSLSSLGRSDSKSPSRTCHGITTVGKPCRKAIKKGSREKYCYIHRDQKSVRSRAKLLGAKPTTTVVEEYEDDSDGQRLSLHVNDPTDFSPMDYPTPEPSPSPPRRVSITRTPPLPITCPARQQTRPSMQPSTPSSMYPPTPPLSIRSHNIESPKKGQKGTLLKLGKAIQKFFRPNSGTPKSPNSALQHTPTLDRAFRRDELTPTRYSRTISPTSLPSSNSPTPSPRSPSKPTRKARVRRQPLTPTTQHTPKPSNVNDTDTHTTPTRLPAVGHLLYQSTSGRTRIERSWETMWVPGINGLGAHIICIEWLSPNLSIVGHQKILSCMRTPLSAGEKPGYIYVYKISEHDEGKEGVYYKVGRTQNLTRRLYQWGQSCSYTPLLVEFFPGPPVSTPRPTSSTSSLISAVQKTDTGRPTRSVMCAVTHRVERLIHLELEDRFGRVDIGGEGGCKCGKIHKEWFRGWDGEGGGWSLVRDIIMRWVGFGRIAYGEVRV